MNTGFLLVETKPGRERDVLESLSDLPEVAERSLIFRENLAVRLKASADALGDALDRVRDLDGVTGTRYYPTAAAASPTAMQHRPAAGV